MLKYLVTTTLLLANVSQIQCTTCSGRHFEKVGIASSLHPDFIVSSHNASMIFECFTHCTKDASCVGFNYKDKEKKEMKENCQLSNKTQLFVAHGDWTFFRDAKQKILVSVVKAYCGKPKSPSRGYTQGEDYTYGSTVKFHCNEGNDVLDGPSTATCLANSKWSNLPSKCHYLRLSGADHSDRGRVEMYRAGYGWYTFCNHNWGMKDAKVVCRELGFTGATAVKGNEYYGKGKGRITDLHPNCRGSESFLKNCPRDKSSFWSPGCNSHSTDVGVDCY